MVERNWGTIFMLFCAWVLWHENETMTLDRGMRHWWETPTAYSTKEECEEVQVKMFKVILNSENDTREKVNKGEVKSVPNNLVIYSRDHFSWTHKLTCLPDSVNPK